MKCKEFREQLESADQKIDSRLEKHLEKCADCESWLDAQILPPPTGLTPPKLEIANSRCMPDLATFSKKPEEPAKEPEQTFWGTYFSGLKYGFVFSLAMVVGLALLPLVNPEKPESSIEERTVLSFYDESDKALPNFVESQKFDVTFFEFESTNISSFVDYESIPSFIDENENEQEELL